MANQQEHPQRSASALGSASRQPGPAKGGSWDRQGDHHPPHWDKSTESLKRHGLEGNRNTPEGQHSQDQASRQGRQHFRQDHRYSTESPAGNQNRDWSSRGDIGMDAEFFYQNPSIMQEYKDERDRGYRNAYRDRDDQNRQGSSSRNMPGFEGGLYDSERYQSFSSDRHDSNRMREGDRSWGERGYARYGADRSQGGMSRSGGPDYRQESSYDRYRSEERSGNRPRQQNERQDWQGRARRQEEDRRQESSTYKAMFRGGRFDSDSSYGSNSPSPGGSYPERSSYGGSASRRGAGQDTAWGRDFSRGSDLDSRTGGEDRYRSRERQQYGTGDRRNVGGYSHQGGSRYDSDDRGGASRYGSSMRGNEGIDTRRFMASDPDATSSNWGGRYGRGYGSARHQDDSDRDISSPGRYYPSGSPQSQSRSQSGDSRSRKFYTGDKAYDYGNYGNANYEQGRSSEREEEQGFLDKAADRVADRVRHWFGSDEHEGRNRR